MVSRLVFFVRSFHLGNKWIDDRILIDARHINMEAEFFKFTGT